MSDWTVNYLGQVCSSTDEQIYPPPIKDFLELAQE